MSAREVEQGAAESSRRGKPPSSRDSGRELPPSSALEGRYRSLFVLGRGGMGSVEAALEITDEEGEKKNEATDYRRVVALKRLLPEAARDARRAEMFLREARVAQMLDHPNVVRAFDYGEIEGEMFLAMEYVEGQPLSRVLRATKEAKKKLSPAFVAWILAEVCDGLHAAHELKGENGEALNLVHRDVSPQNVMLGYDGRVRLLDFGVAKIETENVTKTGEVKGKTAYMSPEQAMGEAIDRRSDLFGVGAILYEGLALERMWGDGTDMEVIRKLALEEPPPLEKADPKAPSALRELYTQLVARDVKLRPGSAREAADALRTIAQEHESETGPDAVRAVLDLHFAGEAEEQRRRLTSALESVAPERLDLRESFVPTSQRSRPSVPAAKAKAVDPTPPAKEAPNGNTKTIAIGGAALGLLAIMAWRISSGAPAEATVTTPASATTTIATSAPLPPATPSLTATLFAPAPATAPSSQPTTSTTPTTTSTPAIAQKPPPAPATMVKPASSKTGAPSSVTAPAPSPTTTTVAPPTSSRPKVDVDPI